MQRTYTDIPNLKKHGYQLKATLLQKSTKIISRAYLGECNGLFLVESHKYLVTSYFHLHKCVKLQASYIYSCAFI